MIGIEVKDEVGYNEVLKGIGQAIGYLQYCHGSYIASPEESSLPVLFTGTMQTVGERVFFLILGSDIEKGRYNVTFSLSHGCPCLLHLFHGIPEISGEKLIIFKDIGQ